MLNDQMYCNSISYVVVYSNINMKSKPGNFNHGKQKPAVKINFKNKFVFTF